MEKPSNTPPSTAPGIGISLAGDAPKDVSFKDVYETEQMLRSGSYGVVYVCHPKSDKKTTFAVKIIDRKKLKDKDDQLIFREAEVMKNTRSIPNVITLIDFFVSPAELHIVQVFAAGGDVFDRLTKREHYTEKDARDLAKLLLETMHALHSMKPYPIVHRDLKPENLLLEDADNDASMLLADFGFARVVGEEKCKTRCGTPAFVAPEILIGLPYGTSVDLWSTGCLIYMLLGGYPPFTSPSQNHRELFRKIRAGDYTFHAKHWSGVSLAAKQCITNLLTVAVDKRWTAERALDCDWFKKKTAVQLSANDLSGRIKEVKKFDAKLAWKSTAKAIGYAATAPFWHSDAISFPTLLTRWDQEFKLEDASSGDAAPLMAKVHRVKFDQVYERKSQLRKGSYATVWKCVHKESKEIYAVKIIERKGLAPKDDEAVLNEVAIMQSLNDQKYCVQLMDFYEEPDKFYLVMEYMEGGDVFDRVIAMTHYTENDARGLAELLLKSLGNLHKLGIAHRDVKPQNLLLRSALDNSSIKLADFGFARRVHTPESLTTRVGTPTYVAPEILKNMPHDQRVDLWSIGVVIFVLLVGYPPFLDENQTRLFEKIRMGEWKFDENDWKHISQDARDLVRGLLVVDPKERITIEQALGSSWIRRDKKNLSSVSLSDSLQLLQKKRMSLRSLAKAVMWTGKGSKTEDVATQAQPKLSTTSVISNQDSIKE